MALMEHASRFVTLDPGELFLGIRPMEVHTVLGSCVSVVLFHPHRKLGAICHGKLPSRPCDHGCNGLKVCRLMGDYVSCAFHFMLSWFDQMGIAARELEVKLFGGAMMFTLPGKTQEESIAIGRRNVEVAMDLIREKKLRLVSSDVGGPWGRRIVFHSGTGEIRLQRIRKTELELIEVAAGRTTLS
ncbi:MAG: chemotaxis protein CheD [Magnetococcales bacterium]|nr:chemotaxis protein CheD [Magnetococcales bacterium]